MAAMFGFAGPAGPGAGVAGSDPLNPAGEEWEDFPLLPGTGRKPAVKGRITGKITEWKGKFGWIVPDEPVNHPEARMKGGRIYLSQEDVKEVISGVGALVSFYVFGDGKGLGALHCVPSDSATTKKKITRAKPKPKPKATPGRNRVGEDPLSGKVKSWRGGFGFITPSEPVDHPLFTGSLFLHSNDVLSTGTVEVGQTVSFYLYSDPQGLGAEACTVEDGDDDGTGGTPSITTPVEDTSSSGVLKAKSKATSAAGMMVATAKAGGPTAKGMMRATPKASAAVKATGDPDLARKMAEHPEIAKQLSAWMFDPGG